MKILNLLMFLFQTIIQEKFCFFKWICRFKGENSEYILNNILNISSTYIQDYYDFIKKKKISKALTLFQVITPMKGGILGVDNLNIQLQNFLIIQRKSFCFKNLWV